MLERRFSWLWFALAACGSGAQDSARIAELEAKVQALEAQVGPSAQPGFEIGCPNAWQLLGAVGDASWACRKQQALPDGFWPNCNVVEAPLERRAESQAPLSAKEAFDASLSGAPQLQSARRVSERASVLDREPAHEAIYEHDLLTKPLRVLATVAVHGNRTFAVSCAAPPEAFAANEPAFRQITQSLKFKP